MNEEDVKHNKTRFAVYSLSLSYGVNPNLIENILPMDSTGYIEASELFDEYEFNISPRFRISSSQYTNIEQAGELVTGFNLTELVLVRSSLGHRTTTPFPFSIELESRYLNRILQELSKLLDLEFSNHLYQIGSGKIKKQDIVAYNATAVLFVDNIDSLNVESGSSIEKKGKISDGRRFFVMGSQNLAKASKVRSGQGAPNLRSVVWIIEYPEFVDWAFDNRKQKIKLFPELLKNIENSQEKLAVIHEIYFLLLTWGWLRERCISILNEIPKGVGKGTLKDMMNLTEALIVLKTTHIQIMDFLTFRNDDIFKHDCPLCIGEPKMEFSGLTNLLEGVDTQLTMLENVINNKLVLRQIRTMQQHDKQESRRELAFNIIAIILSALVVFEVIAGWFSWLLNPDYLVSHILWLMLIIVMFLVIFTSIYIINSKYQFPKSEQDDF